jgi:hypothetical protein
MNNYSIVTQFKTNSYGMLFACDNNNVYPYKRLWVYLSAEGNITIERYNASTMGGTYWSGAYGFATTKNGLNDDKWHMVAVRYDGKTLNVVIDNKYWESFRGPANNTSIIGSEASMESGETVQVTVGANAQNNCPNFIGKIDELRIYSRAITDDEINQLYTRSSR